MSGRRSRPDDRQLRAIVCHREAGIRSRIYPLIPVDSQSQTHGSGSAELRLHSHAYVRAGPRIGTRNAVLPPWVPRTLFPKHQPRRTSAGPPPAALFWICRARGPDQSPLSSTVRNPLGSTLDRLQHNGSHTALAGSATGARPRSFCAKTCICSSQKTELFRHLPGSVRTLVATVMVAVW